MITSPAFAGKTYGVYGLARSGTATVAALQASGATTLAWDDDEAVRAAFPGELTDLHTTDLRLLEALVVSPGVPHSAPLFVAAVAAGIPVIGDIELFAQARPQLPPHKVVGITGTNGKSTTTALIHHILTNVGLSATMGGNIGLPILAQDPLPAGGTYVLELSSYQLDLTFSLDCDIAILLNITPDHLDRHGDLATYAAAKARLFAMQSPGQIAIIDRLSDLQHASLAITTGLDIHFIDDVAATTRADWPALQGPHNLQNARAAIAACTALGLTTSQIESGLKTYPGLPHRMERIAHKSGILFINDSKATNPESTAPALTTFPRTHWIAGGRPKGTDLTAILPHLGNTIAAYLIGEAAPLFAPILAPHIPVTQSHTLAQAVTDAAAAAHPGDTILLSPACASFDQFTDFEARGAAFRAAVAALPETLFETRA